MKKLSVSIFALAVLFSLSSAFTLPTTFTGYRLFVFNSETTQPESEQSNPTWYNSNLEYTDQQAVAYDLAVLVDPTQDPGDELCAVSSEVCIAQIHIIDDAVDTGFGVDFEPGSLIEE